MGDVSLILLTLLLLQLLAAAAWALATPRLEVPPRELRHWAASSLLSAVVLALVLAQGSAPDWLTSDVSAVLGAAAFLAMRRGLLLFLRRSPGDIEAGVLLAVMSCAALVVVWLPVERVTPVRIGLNCSLLTWILLRTATQAWPALRREFGEKVAFAILAPQLATASLFLFRLVALAFTPALGLQPLPVDSALNVAVVMVLLLLCVLLQGSLAAAVALRMVGKLRRLSQHDALTGLFNRAEWSRRLDAQHRWLGRFGEPFALLMIDVDHFKAINDTLGHAAGDAVLITIAQVLTASAREVDVVGRVGGEEFCVLLPRAEAASSRHIAERLRKAIGDTEITWRQHAIRVTVSVGLAIASDAEETPQQILDRADKAMYQSKRMGRNRTSMARFVAR